MTQNKWYTALIANDGLEVIEPSMFSNKFEDGKWYFKAELEPKDIAQRLCKKNKYRYREFDTVDEWYRVSHANLKGMENSEGYLNWKNRELVRRKQNDTE